MGDPSGEITLRPATPADADFYYDVRTAGFRAHVEQCFGPWDDAFQRPLADKDFAELPVRIIERDGEPIGYVIVVHESDHRYLDEIALVPEARGTGIGTRLVQDVMADAHAAGLPVRLSVLHVNPAQALYARLGFRVTRIVPPRVKMEWP